MKRIPEWVRAVAVERGRKHLIADHLILGLVHQESGGNPDALRFEKSFHAFERPAHFADSGPQSYQTELNQQACSWGLAQVMGCTARRFGFAGAYLTEFCRDPALSVEYGCIHLRRDLDSGCTIQIALARYNGGRVGNPGADGSIRSLQYLNSVLALSRLYL